MHKKTLFLGLGVVLALGGFFLLKTTPVSEASSTQTDTSGRLLKNGDLISAGDYGDPDIYIVGSLENHNPSVSGYKRLFLNPAIFSFYGHLGGFANVHQVTPAVRDSFETSGLFRNCETNNQKVWATEVTGEDNGILHHVNLAGEVAVQQDPYFFNKVFCINSREDNYYPKSISAYLRLADLPTYRRKNCQIRPACLDASPRCYPPEPIDGWCPNTTPTPPPGCYYHEVQCIRAPCSPELVCPTPTSGCYVGGCSGEICSDSVSMSSICQYRATYVCYQNARCERQASGQCGWTQDSAFVACWNANGGY